MSSQSPIHPVKIHGDFNLQFLGRISSKLRSFTYRQWKQLDTACQCQCRTRLILIRGVRGYL